ncbi:hypothetical protein OIV83_000567 [Microbotryomycetes sp. JL201]|nr:hypothetical protein OIV83_000567 [Microbotryomycetes sp. JL201]
MGQQVATHLLQPGSPVSSLLGLAPGLTDDESDSSNYSASPARSRSPSLSRGWPAPTKRDESAFRDMSDLLLKPGIWPETPRSPAPPMHSFHSNYDADQNALVTNTNRSQSIRRARFDPSDSLQEVQSTPVPQSVPRFVPTFEHLHWQPAFENEAARQLRTPLIRRLGPTELSYYLATRGQGEESGVNDMYLHIGKASQHLPRRLRLTFGVDLHRLQGEPDAYDTFTSVDYRTAEEEAYFVHHPPVSKSEARIRAGSLMALVAQHSHQDLLDDYLNGPRTLADNRLSFFVISSPEPQSTLDSADVPLEYHFMLFCSHFIGDGMALHATANEFFQLLTSGSDDSFTATDALDVDVRQSNTHDLPEALETCLKMPQQSSNIRWAAACVDYASNQRQQVGGHALRRKRLGSRETTVRTVAIDAIKTKTMLASCKAHGTTISNAVMGLVNVAHIRANPDLDTRQPMLFYSAMSIRSALEAQPRKACPSLPEDHFRIAISYFNIILPSFLPKSTSTSEIFWARCHSVKRQTTKAVKSPFLKSRAIKTALEREQRSINFAREDECKEQMSKDTGLGLHIPLREPVRPITPPQAVQKAPQKVPSTALMGLSMLGNLDGVYTHKTYEGVELESLTTGSRQRPGALLLFAYTFAGKLWFSLGYDRNGFESGTIETFWSEFLQSADEFLL